LISKAILCAAVAGRYLHAMRIVHSDITPEHILFNESTEPRVPLYVFIREFGDPRRSSVPPRNPLYLPAKVLGLNRTQRTRRRPYWDIVCFGGLVYSVFTSGFTPETRLRYTDEAFWREWRLQGKPLPRPEGIPDLLWGIVEGCYSPNKADRPTFDSIVDSLDASADWYLEGTDPEQLRIYKDSVTAPVPAGFKWESRLTSLLVHVEHYEEIGHENGLMVCRERATGRYVARKRLSLPGGQDRDIQKPYEVIRFFRELQIQVALGRNRPADPMLYLPLEGFALLEDVLYIFVPYMPNGTLDDLRGPDQQTPTHLSLAIFGVAAAMEYVHKRKVIHHDLKGANVLLNEDFEPVIADFGWAQYSKHIGFQGRSILYASPEVLREDEDLWNLPAVDVYSYGVTVWSLLVDPDVLGRWASTDSDEFRAWIIRGQRFERPDNITETLWNLITQCWRQGAASRPTFREVTDRLIADRDWVIPGTELELLDPYIAKVEAIRDK
jgi:serine/threonine protein kinase